MCDPNALYLVKDSESRSINSNKICLKIIQKALKKPLQQVNFQIFSGGHAPDPPFSPPEPFLLRNQLKLFLP